MARAASQELSRARVAVYARFSSDRQSETSIKDQVDRCREYLDARGGTVRDEHVFSDYAVSGAVLHRPGFDALLAAVDAGSIDVVIVESLTRVTRDVGDADSFRKRLAFRDVRLVGVGDGIDTSHRGHELHYGMKALIADQYRRDLGDMTHRGLTGRARAMKVTGALPYGYASEPSPDGDGKVAIVDPTTAPIVVEIFERYARGESQAAIAAWLNGAGIPTSGRKRTTWQGSAVRAMLHNPKYRGEWIWNTHRWVRDPVTRKRRYRKRPEDEWIREDREDLRIIPEDLWTTVAAKFTRNAKRYGKRGAPNRYLLSGLVFCAQCGEPMHVHGGKPTHRYYGCAGYRKRGDRVCSNDQSLREPALRAAVLGEVNRCLLGRDAQRMLREVATEEIRAMAAGGGQERQRLQRQVKDLGGKIDNVIASIASGLDSPALRQALAGFEAGRAEAEQRLSMLDSAAQVLPSPELIAQRAQALAHALDGDTPGAREALASMLTGGRIDLQPLGRGEGYMARGAFDPGVLIGVAKTRKPAAAEARAGLPIDGCGGRI